MKLAELIVMVVVAAFLLVALIIMFFVNTARFCIEELDE